MLRLLYQPGDECFLGLLRLFLGTQRNRRCPYRMGQGKQGCEQGHGVCLKETAGNKGLLEFSELGLGRILAVKL